MLAKIREGDANARAQLVQLVYKDLRRIAAVQLRRERPNHTLQATALVNETYLRLLGKNAAHWENTAHFFSAAASAMRNVLVDHARALNSKKRGEGAAKSDIERLNLGIEDRVEEILAVDQALDKLGKQSPRQKTIVEMRFYAGFTEEEIGEILHISARQVKRDWAIAKSWLYGEMAAAETGQP